MLIRAIAAFPLLMAPENMSAASTDFQLMSQKGEKIDTTYRNSFYRPMGHDPEFYKTTAKPVEYKGYLLYQRLKGICWDVVKDGVCIGQYGGRAGCEAFVDRGCKRFGVDDD